MGAGQTVVTDDKLIGNFPMDGAPVLDRFDNDHKLAAGSSESTAKQSAVHTITVILIENGRVRIDPIGHQFPRGYCVPPYKNIVTINVINIINI